MLFRSGIFLRAKAYGRLEIQHPEQIAPQYFAAWASKALKAGIDAAFPEDVSGFAQYNIDKALEIADKITGICQEPLHFEVILQKLFASYGLTMNFKQYVLAGSTVRSYLSWLKDTGRLNAAFENNQLLWRRV